MVFSKRFFSEIRHILSSARTRAVATANREMLYAYWQVGRRITEEEQRGARRAQYGSFLIRELAVQLTQALGKGFEERELRRMRQFYQYFPIRDAVRPELTWTHYRYILRVEDSLARQYYVTEAISSGWNTRQLERNVNSQYYERRLTHKNRKNDPSLANKQTLATDLIKDPYFLEFLQIQKDIAFSENELESAIISKLQQFLLELGRGFAFVGRQYQLRTETKEFYIDLVFYNYILKCFVLVDLKITELTHQDIGQMDMYVRLFEDLKKIEGDNPTIGIILCSDKDETIVKYSVLKDSENIFASSYRLCLPDEKTLIAEIEREKQMFQAAGLS